ncbi:MAG: pitrilysin family protein [candidate division Zixibacteria bacterium]|nr:pitrilysin family protein [candidate division Zixibacteria bacterium]
MIKKISFFSLFLIFIILLSGIELMAQREIDIIKFPNLGMQKAPKIEKINLDNGLTLYLLENRQLPIVKAAVRFGAGEYLVPKEKIGLASITGEVMRTGGTEKMSGDKIDEALEAIGATIEVNFEITSGTARMTILSDYVDTGLAILADVLQRPIFDPDKIDLKKTSERSEIARRNDDPFDICIREYSKIIYGSESPYARRMEYSTINDISRDDLIAFHKQYVTPENTMMALWGDFNKKEMKAKLIKYFGGWAKGPGRVPQLPAVNYEFKSGVHYVQKDNINQTSILLGHIGGYTGDPDYFAMTIMNKILADPSVSRLYNNVRSKQGLAYAVGGDYTSNIAYPGIYYNYCLTKSQSTVKAIKSMLDEIKRMQTDLPTPEEMRQGKDGYLNSFVFNFEHRGNILIRLMEYDYFGFPNDFLYKVKDNIEKVAPLDVITVARNRLHPDALQILVVGRGADFDESLSVLGKVDTIDITIPSGEVKGSITATPEALARGKELLGLAVMACGGKENLAKINTVSSKTTINMILPQGEIALQSNSILAFPDKIKNTLITPMGEMVSISNGQEGWIKQGDNIMPAPPEQMDETQKELFRNIILIFKTYDNPGYQVTFVPAERLTDPPVNTIQIISADGKSTFKLDLDAKTNLPTAKYYFGETMMGPGNLVELYSDYRNISGIEIPFATQIMSEGKKVMEITVSEYQINPAIPEGFFEKPE